MDNCTADLSEFAQPGENTIEVRVTSSLRNRTYDLGYDVNWTMWHQTPEIDSYGMVGDTTLKVYTKVVGQSTDQPSSDNPETPSTNESTNSPQTGDAAPIIGITVLTMASATMLIFRKKK